MTLRAQIELVLADGPLTGAEIRKRLPVPIGSIAVHRYLGTMRERGYLSARRRFGVWTYAAPGYRWPEQASAWDWRAIA